MIIPPDVFERSGKDALFQMGFIMWEGKKAGEINHRSFYGPMGLKVAKRWRFQFMVIC